MQDVEWIFDQVEKIERSYGGQTTEKKIIFAFLDRLTDDLVPGGLIEMKASFNPAHLEDKEFLIKFFSSIKRVFLKDIRGEIHTMPPNRAIFAFNFQKITEFF